MGTVKGQTVFKICPCTLTCNWTCLLCGMCLLIVVTMLAKIFVTQRAKYLNGNQIRSGYLPAVDWKQSPFESWSFLSVGRPRLSPRWSIHNCWLRNSNEPRAEDVQWPQYCLLTVQFSKLNSSVSKQQNGDSERPNRFQDMSLYFDM